MITTNETKKALIQKLLENKHITIDDAYMLLDESGLVSYPVYPSWPGSGWWGIYPPTPWDAGKVYIGDYPPSTCGTGVISWTACTDTLTDTISIGSASTTDTVCYTQEQLEQMYRSGQISYTVRTT